jgi:hypothetical protein
MAKMLTQLDPEEMTPPRAQLPLEAPLPAESPREQAGWPSRRVR